MRPGSVVSIRVNPKDSMSVVDLVKKSGLFVEGMSFPHMVSLALSGCLQALRDNGGVPERDGFEYLEICGPYVQNQQRNGRKLMIADAVHKAGSDFTIRLPTQEASPNSAPTMPDTRTTEQRMAGRMLHELCEKLDLSRKNPDVTWQKADQEEYDRLFKIVYPEG
jgi:hypothetical protein